MSPSISLFLYIISSLCFIMALRGLSAASTARQGNLYAVGGMAIAILTSLLSPSVHHYGGITVALTAGGAIGWFIVRRIDMTALPQLIAGFHSLVGVSAVLVATAALCSPETFLLGVSGQIPATSLLEMSLGSAIGAITFTGSVVAFLKLHGSMKSAPFTFSKSHLINGALGAALVVCILLFISSESKILFLGLTALAFLLGFLLIIPIGGADMPVVISMLNSYSGWAAAGIGFTLNNYLLIITGALVGASGAILSYIMCKAMNRSLCQVMAGGFGTASSAGDSSIAEIAEGEVACVVGVVDIVKVLKKAKSVIIVPGYGMAVAQAQYSLREIADFLKEKGVRVSYAIHPVAGRMPGHMNVLLAEAQVPYEEVKEFDVVNNDFKTTDVALIIGANDITNPAAKNDPMSSIYGMPVFDVEEAKTVIFVKRSLGAGYAGINNALFQNKKTLMILGDARKVCEEVVKALRG